MPQAQPPDTLFQQEGGLLHYSREARALLDEKLPNLGTGRDGSTNCQDCSPNFNSIDFFSWG